MKKLRFSTYLEAAFLAVLNDQTDVWWLNAHAKELDQVFMLHFLHLS